MSSQPAEVAVESPEARSRNGVIAALLAFGMWGFLPIYFKVLQQVAATEILAHRIVWAVPFGALIIWGRRQWPEVRAALRNRSTMGFLLLSAIFIAVNWLVYVWAVQNEQIFQASLGYYINPLLYVVIGVALFGERLRGFQVGAVILAFAGVAVLTFSGGVFPGVSLALATSFTIYGVIRKHTNIGGMPGLFIETVILTPVALLWLFYMMQNGEAVLASASLTMNILLILAGPITVLPLLCFALAARRLTLSTVGMMQFIAPTLQFLVGVAYGERLTTAHAICFSLIWFAVALFSWDAWRSSRSRVPLAPA